MHREFYKRRELEDKILASASDRLPFIYLIRLSDGQWAIVTADILSGSDL